MRSLILSLAGWLLLVGSPRPAPAEESLSQALAQLSERLEENPRDPALLTDFGNLLVRDGRLEAALEAYDASLDLEPESVITLYNLGLLELELGRTRPARRHLKSALDLEPSFARGHYALGTLFEKRDRHRQAVEHYARAFTLDPELLEVGDNPEVLYSKLATWASISSYLASSGGRGTRLYNDPKPIIGLLIPEIDSLTGPPVEPATEDANESDQR